MRFILILSLCSSGLFAQDINEKILFAAARDQIDSLNIFLLQDSIDLDYRYENGYSALDYAIERNHKDVFKRLVEYYASVNESKNTLDSLGSKLIPAVLNNDLGGVKQLLALDADPNYQHCSGYHPLSLAARWEALKIMHILLDNGADVNASNKNRYNTTPLMEASRNGNVAVANMLISAGADVNKVDINNDPPINWATYFGHTDMVRLLLKFGARTDLVGKDSGDAALAIARRMKHQEIVGLLEKHTAERKIK